MTLELVEDNGRFFRKDITFNTANDFIRYINESHDLDIGNYWHTCNAIPSRFIFRGQANKNWPLRPTAFREEPNFSQFTPQPPSKRDNKYLGLQMKAEEYSVIKFIEHADSVGLETPLDYSTFHLHLEQLNKAFNDHEYQHTDSFPDAKVYAAFALAQHHGIPTRLLDWSESVLIAAFFAAEGYVFNQSKFVADDETFFSIYCLDINLLGKELLLIKAPKAGNHFLRSQKGLFTLSKNANSFYHQFMKWPSIEDTLKDRLKTCCTSSYPFMRLSLPTSEAHALLKILYRNGISKLTLMPSFSNAALDFEYRKTLFPKS